MGRAGADSGQGHAGGPAGRQTQLRPQAVQAHISQYYLLSGTEKRKPLCRGDYMEYAWTLKVTKNDGSDQYTHLVDEGLFMKYALLHSQKHF